MYIFPNGDNGNLADESYSLVMHLFSPSDTTYVKQFYFTSTGNEADEGVSTAYSAGYVNTTSAITQVKFTPNSGDFDGVFQLYGIA